MNHSKFMFWNALKLKKGFAAILLFPFKVYDTWRRIAVMESRLVELGADQQRVKRYGFFNGKRCVFFYNKSQGNELIHEMLLGSKPVMITRHGRVELEAASSFEFDNRIKNLEELHLNAGFFPKHEDMAKQWADLYLRCCRDLDCLCAWNYRFGLFVEEENIFAKYTPDAQVISQMSVLTPFFEENPWTRALKGKKVLVIHPFDKSIRMQYEKRHLLFSGRPEMLPSFAELHTIKAVQTIVGNTDSRFNTWFDAYKWMCDESDRIDFDIALIAAGAYGLPLASHIKRKGRKAVHIGGGLQLLFGITGTRWKSDPAFRLGELVNENWVVPLPEERPVNALKIENGAYW